MSPMEADLRYDGGEGRRFGDVAGGAFVVVGVCAQFEDVREEFER